MRIPSDPVLRGRAWTGLLVAGIAVCAGGPLVALGAASLSRAWFYPDLLPRHLDLSAWQDLLGAGGPLPAALLNSLVLATTCAALSALLGAPAARALASLRGSRAGALKGALVVLPVLPPVLLGAGTHYFFLATALAGTLPAVLLAHLMITLPYATIVLLGAVRTTDPRLEAVAATLGASSTRRAWRVRVPLLWPSLLLVLLFSFLISWGQYGLTLVVGEGRIQTLPTLVFSYVRGGNETYAAVAGVLMALPALLGAPLLGRGLARVRPGAW